MNLIKENLSASCVGNIELRMSVNKPEVEETILTTGAAVRESESWNVYWPRKNGSAKINAVWIENFVACKNVARMTNLCNMC